MIKHGWHYGRVALGLLWALLCAPLWASELHIEHLSDGRTSLALSGNGRWAETVHIEVTPAWAVQSSTQSWPMQVEIRPEEVRRVIAEIRLAPGAQVSFNRRSRPGLVSAQHQDSYAYLRPIPSMGALAGGEAQGRAVLGEAVRVARDGIVVQAEARDDAGYVLVAHADGTLGSYSGFRPGADLPPGRYVNRGGVLGQGVGTYTLLFRVERPAASLDAAQAPQPVISAVWRDDVKFVAQVLAVTAGLLFAFPLRRRSVVAKRTA
ncbi:hypothetical protein EGI20_10020, partial [Aquitalea sp. S1-19]|nr:hypothetical protein [Aquitalea sp. S1-19]